MTVDTGTRACSVALEVQIVGTGNATWCAEETLGNQRKRDAD